VLKTIFPIKPVSFEPFDNYFKMIYQFRFRCTISNILKIYQFYRIHFFLIDFHFLFIIVYVTKLLMPLFFYKIFYEVLWIGP
jgi:hypothetical protein